MAVTIPDDSTVQRSTWRGRSATCTVKVTGEMIDEFAWLTGDTAPVHLDDQFAHEEGFAGRLAHGMLLGALVSRVIGKELPGPAGVLQGISLSFRNPCYVGDEITIAVSVHEYIASVDVVQLDIQITRPDGTLLAKGHAQSGLMVTASHEHT